MRERHHIHRFTQEQVEQLAANPFTLSVTVHRISFTLEFKNLFLSRYENGESVKDIFVALGYDPDVIGYNRLYASSKRAMRSPDMDLSLTASHHRLFHSAFFCSVLLMGFPVLSLRT